MHCKEEPTDTGDYGLDQSQEPGVRVGSSALFGNIAVAQPAPSWRKRPQPGYRESLAMPGRPNQISEEKEMDQTEKLLKEITEASGVPGYEGDVRAVMRRHLEDCGHH